MPSKLRLPPLPPKRWMKKFFPALVASRMLALSHFRAKGRLNIIDRELCNRAVRAIKLRPNEIVIDCFSGPGQMTRALLSGGKTDVEEEAAIKRSWLEATEKASVKPGTTKQNQPAELATFPSWARTFDPEGGYDQDFQTREPEVVEGEVVKPKLVVACEPANGLLQRAHNVSLSWLEHAKWWLKNNMVPHNAYDKLPDIVAKSEYEDNLLLSVGNPYDWTILPLILSHPLVGAQRRAFDAEAPAITIVAEIPQSDTGEQMIQQWVASAASARTGEASWIWEFGRVRMVWFIENRIYDVSLAVRNPLTSVETMCPAGRILLFKGSHHRSSAIQNHANTPLSPYSKCDQGAKLCHGDSIWSEPIVSSLYRPRHQVCRRGGHARTDENLVGRLLAGKTGGWDRHSQSRGTSQSSGEEETR